MDVVTQEQRQEWGNDSLETMLNSVSKRFLSGITIGKDDLMVRKDYRYQSTSSAELIITIRDEERLTQLKDSRQVFTTTDSELTEYSISFFATGNNVKWIEYGTQIKYKDTEMPAGGGSSQIGDERIVTYLETLMGSALAEGLPTPEEA